MRVTRPGPPCAVPSTAGGGRCGASAVVALDRRASVSTPRLGACRDPNGRRGLAAFPGGEETLRSRAAVGVPGRAAHGGVSHAPPDADAVEQRVTRRTGAPFEPPGDRSVAG